MAIEALLLGAILVGGVVPKDESNIYLAVALTAMAMGTQNTSLRMARVLGVYTTHITGTITRLSEDIVSSAFGRRGRGKEIGLNAALWATFLLGALAAALLMTHAAPGRLLALPIGAILLVGALDLRAPLAQLDS
jgi:uncharacterized membrane protein YoaK (UPF0700 family)